MPTRTQAADTQGGDPFRIVADAMSEAAQAVGDGAADAKAHAADMVTTAGGFLGRLTYNAGYAVSYGVVFSALLVARAIPRENAMVHGLTDGARAARDVALGRDRA